jgi:hypothetical protein
MKLLAYSHTLVDDAVAYTADLLRAEARHVWELQQAGVVREIYFTQDREAVLILEGRDAAEAAGVLAQFPLVRAQLIEFKVDELTAYDGYARLFAAK